MCAARSTGWSRRRGARPHGWSAYVGGLRILVRVLGEPAGAAERLVGLPGVSQLAHRSDGAWELAFAGGDAELAALLRAIVERGRRAPGLRGRADAITAAVCLGWWIVAAVPFVVEELRRDGGFPWVVVASPLAAAVKSLDAPVRAVAHALHVGLAVTSVAAALALRYRRSARRHVYAPPGAAPAPRPV